MILRIFASMRKSPSGIEPATSWLKANRSTTELRRHNATSWIRTNNCRNQSPVPYHLAIVVHFRKNHIHFHEARSLTGYYRIYLYEHKYFSITVPMCLLTASYGLKL